MALRDWIAFTRWNSAAAPVPITLMGLLLAGVPVVSWQILAFAVFALAYHSLGSAQNNLFDYRFGYDPTCPGKSNFPTVRGAIPIRKANWIVNYSLVGLFLYGAVLSNMQPWSLLFLGLGIISGVVYNACSKDMVLGFVHIAICYSSLTMFAYFAYASELSTLILLVYIYIILTSVFQIAVSGWLKDLMLEGEENLMRTLGYKVENNYLSSTHTGYLFGFTTKLAAVLLAGAISFKTGSNPALVGIFGAALLLLAHDILKSKAWNWELLVKEMVLVEIFSYFIFIAALQGMLGWSLAAAFMVIPLLWFMAWNRVFYDSYLLQKF